MSKPENNKRIPFGGASSAKPVQASEVEKKDDVTDEDEELEEMLRKEQAEAEAAAAAKAEAPAAPAVEASGPIIAPAVMAVPVRGPKLVSVRPRMDIPRALIGGTYYSFRKNVSIDVSEDVKRVLSERGII